MNIDSYLARIGVTGSVSNDLASLRAIHRSHLFSIPYENVDVMLQRSADQNIERIFDKMVQGRRGGWCYEMNGLLGWALGEIGFDVMRMTGGVMRKERGDRALGNHLVLCVQLDEPYIADVGLGHGLMEPIPLREGRFEQAHMAFALEPLGDDLWRFHNDDGAMPPTFDFRYAPADEALLADTCNTLQNDPESMFRQNLVCQRMDEQGVALLLGRLLTWVTARGRTKRC